MGGHHLLLRQKRGARGRADDGPGGRVEKAMHSGRLSKVTMDALWKHPFTCFVAGPTGCGKSTLVTRMLRHAAAMIHPPPPKRSHGVTENGTPLTPRWNNRRAVRGTVAERICVCARTSFQMTVFSTYTCQRYKKTKCVISVFIRTMSELVKRHILCIQALNGYNSTKLRRAIIADADLLCALAECAYNILTKTFH